VIVISKLDHPAVNNILDIINTPGFFTVNSSYGGIIHHPYSSQYFQFIIVADPIDIKLPMNEPVSNRFLHEDESQLYDS
jgi:hypothetical protein